MRHATAIINVVGLVVCGMLLMQGILAESWVKVTIGALCMLVNVVSLTKYMEK